MQAARRAEPDLSEPHVVALVATNTGLTTRAIGVAIDYWTHYPEEIDAEVRADAVAGDVAEAAWRRRQDLLRRP